MADNTMLVEENTKLKDMIVKLNKKIHELEDSVNKTTKTQIINKVIEMVRTAAQTTPAMMASMSCSSASMLPSPSRRCGGKAIRRLEKTR